MDEAVENAKVLRARITSLCDAKHVHEGIGPPWAYFRSIPDVLGDSEIYQYVAFGVDGLLTEGQWQSGAAKFDDALLLSTRHFDVWLQPSRTLVWRTEPECDKSPDDGLWRVYWRCVQLWRPISRMAIEWNFF